MAHALEGKSSTSASSTLYRKHTSTFTTISPITIRNHADYCWSHVPDATVLTLAAFGHIGLKKASGQLGPDSCVCAIADLVPAQFPEWTGKEQWSLVGFITALRQDRHPLIDTVVKFVDVLHEHKAKFQKFEASDKPCAGSESR